MKLPRFAHALQTAALAVSLIGAGVTASAQDPEIGADEAYQIGLEAYQFLYPLISMDVSRRVGTNAAPDAMPGFGPANEFHHIREYPAADFRAVVRPNFDTLYSNAWLDLTEGPVILSIPDTGGRYFLLPMLDMYTDVFAVPGKRTSGTGAQTYAITPPGWSGELPEGVEAIPAPTPYVWIIGRTQTNGPADYAAVHEVQDGYQLTPLAQWGKDPVPPAAAVIDPQIDMVTAPLDQVNAMPAAEYFSYGAELMGVNPPHLTDWSIVERMKRIGLIAGAPFDLATTPAPIRDGLERAHADGLRSLEAIEPFFGTKVDGWSINASAMGVYGDDYLKRAYVAMAGLGANQPEDAIYPFLEFDANGEKPEGGRKYLLRFPKGGLPPVDAFWSITMYDAQGFQVANAINRFAIGSYDDLKLNDDGSLDIHIQHDSPGAELESNWLPAPASGELGITMRLYAPRPEALDGRWTPPAATRVP